MTTHPAPPIRHLSADDVLSVLPDVATRLDLARRTLVGLVEDAELPPKIAVHPRSEASFAHAMPALLRGDASDGSADLLGMKWVTGFPANADHGMATIHGIVILSDGRTGVPRALLDAGAITAHRTAAVSGVAIERWGLRREARAGESPATRGPRVAILGAGVQGQSHLPVLAHLLPGARLVVTDRAPERAASLAERAAELGFGDVELAPDVIGAVEGADLVLTLLSFGPDRQVVPAESFAPGATIVAVDYDMCVPAIIAREAADARAFLVDDRGQYLFTRAGAVFAGYPDPPSGAMLGEVVRDGRPRPDGRVLVTHLGVGLADVVFGDAIVRAAESAGVGTLLG
jgi:ornithine cyclodeaminase/alanine dehydrogenase-like protein (mu-crystallin family)